MEGKKLIKTLFILFAIRLEVKGLATFVIAFLLSLVLYLLLTAGSGTFLLWSFEELCLSIIVGFIVASITIFITSKLGIEIGAKALNPKRWLLFLAYIFGPFAFSLIKANFEVAFRVLSGNIKPAIVEINPKIKSDLGIAMLANSITLTPGTLTLEEKNRKLYIHWLYAKKERPRIKDVCSSFADWIRRITE